MRHGSLTLDKNMKITDAREKWYRTELARIRALPTEELTKEFCLRISRAQMLDALKECIRGESILHS